MLSFFKGILFMDIPSMKLKKTADGAWMVVKNAKILYIGSKEKCRTYMRQFVSLDLH